MAPRKKEQQRSTRTSAASETLTLYHHLHALLHTVRSIAHFEDELCTLVHAARNRDDADSTLPRDLRTLLERMPSVEYAQDLQLVRSALPARSREGTRSPRKTIAAPTGATKSPKKTSSSVAASKSRKAQTPGRSSGRRSAATGASNRAKKAAPAPRKRSVTRNAATSRSQPISQNNKRSTKR